MHLDNLTKILSSLPSLMKQSRKHLLLNCCLFIICLFWYIIRFFLSFTNTNQQRRYSACSTDWHVPPTAHPHLQLALACIPCTQDYHQSQTPSYALKLCPFPRLIAAIHFLTSRPNLFYYFTFAFFLHWQNLISQDTVQILGWFP